MNDNCILCGKEQPVGTAWSWYEPEEVDFGYLLCPKCDKLSVEERRKKYNERVSEFNRSTQNNG